MQPELLHSTSPAYLGATLLEIGVDLLAAGASVSRIRITMTRIADVYQFEPHITISPKSVFLTLHGKDGEVVFSGTRSMSGHGINFRLIAEISKLSWTIVQEKWAITRVRESLDKIRAGGHYPRFVVLLSVSVAGAGFCFTFGGRAAEMAITFVATFAGLFIKQQMQKMAFNQYICTYGGAAVASLVAGAFFKAGLNIEPEYALATSVLFLIPGVPLINSITDLVDGNTLNGMVRGLNALVFAMAIAFGLLTAMLIFKIHL